jgi:spermidine synthase
VGPLIATYAILPVLGLWAGIAAIGLIMVVAGEVSLQGLFKKRVCIVRQAAILALLTGLTVSQNPFTLPRARIQREGNERLIHIDEGSHGIVAVLESPGDRWMLLNNFYTLGGTASAIEERQQGRIPLLLHPAPRKVAYLGLGTGITAGGALLPTVQKVVALEFIPEVVAAAREYFAEPNLGVLNDGKVEVIHEDARIFLKASRQDFDVIIGDLVVPWRSGESALFTANISRQLASHSPPGESFASGSQCINCPRSSSGSSPQLSWMSSHGQHSGEETFFLMHRRWRSSVTLILALLTFRLSIRKWNNSNLGAHKALPYCQNVAGSGYSSSGS